MAYTKQVKAAAVLNTGFSGAALGGDGVSLFGFNSSATLVNHPLISGGTNGNTPSTASDLNETSLEAATIQIAAWVDERGADRCQARQTGDPTIFDVRGKAFAGHRTACWYR